MNYPSPEDPHPLVLLSTRGSRSLAERIAKYCDTDLGSVIDKPFPNGESYAELKTDVRGRDVFVIGSVARAWNPEETMSGHPYSGVNDALMELLFFGDCAARASAWRITAVVPYFGYARQDRKAIGRTPITARLVAEMIKIAGFNRVLTMDLHANQIQGFFDNRCILDHLNAGQIFADHFQGLGLPDDTVVLSPDVGNLKKADKYRKGLPSSFDIAVIDKRRGPTGVEAKRLIGDVSGKTVILFDDIISTAGTMRSAMDFAANNGAREFYVAATHGEFVGEAKQNLRHKRVKEIVVTDSISQDHPDFSHGAGLNHEAMPKKILSCADLFGDAIMRIHRQESISELLGIFG